LEELKDKYDKMGKDLVRLRAHLMEKEDVHNLELIEGEHRIEALQKKYVSFSKLLSKKRRLMLRIGSMNTWRKKT